MARTNFLRPLSALIVLGVLPTGMACNGQTKASLGDTGDTLEAVTAGAAAAEASGTTASGASAAVACASGWAHPNICCDASQGAEASCGEWDDNPFRACAKGSTTYPNQLSCCELSNPANCVDAPSSSTSPPAQPIPTPPPAYGCGFACPPGWWTELPSPGIDDVPGGNVAMCCTNGGAPCVLQAGADESVGIGVSEDAGLGCPADLPDCQDVPLVPDDAGPVTVGPTGSDEAGTNCGAPVPSNGDDGGLVTQCGGSNAEDAGVSTGGWSGYDGGMASLCPVCPAGWSQDAIQAELCCETLQSGLTLCFSQASGSATSVSGNGSTASQGGTSSGGTGVNGSGSVNAGPPATHP